MFIVSLSFVRGRYQFCTFQLLNVYIDFLFAIFTEMDYLQTLVVTISCQCCSVRTGESKYIFGFAHGFLLFRFRQIQAHLMFNLVEIHSGYIEEVRVMPHAPSSHLCGCSGSLGAYYPEHLTL